MTKETQMDSNEANQMSETNTEREAARKAAWGKYYRYWKMEPNTTTFVKAHHAFMEGYEAHAARDGDVLERAIERIRHMKCLPYSDSGIVSQTKVLAILEELRNAK